MLNMVRVPKLEVNVCKHAPWMPKASALACYERSVTFASPHERLSVPKPLLWLFHVLFTYIFRIVFWLKDVWMILKNFQTNQFGVDSSREGGSKRQELKFLFTMYYFGFITLFHNTFSTSLIGDSLLLISSQYPNIAENVTTYTSIIVNLSLSIEQTSVYCMRQSSNPRKYSPRG